MAQSPSHRFGQIIGDLLEAALFAPLQKVADDHGLYLDYKHLRPARRDKRKVTWVDHKGNKHDLDYVMEQGGDERTLGKPKAFIETAWRRYTKHSRNKAQEIQGAVLPLAETYRDCHPFLGVVLAGVFTKGSLDQLRSHGFRVVYYSYESVVAAFAKAGIDAAFDESTPDAELQRKIEAFKALSEARKSRLVKAFRELRRGEMDEFLTALEASLRRSVLHVSITPLHAAQHELATLDEAIAFLASYREAAASRPFIRYEVSVRYSNGDQVRGDFHEKTAAIDFLRAMA